MIDSKKLHKILGLILIVPLLGWIITGAVFLTKPGYEGAYDRIAVKTYPLEQTFTIRPRNDWHESKILRTVLGDHLLVRTTDQWQHLDPNTLQQKPTPTNEDLKRLALDAISHKSARYGSTLEVANGKLLTETNIEITIDWSTLSLKQSGRDTKLIKTLYKIHYLHWIGTRSANIAFAVFGLLLLAGLVILGLVMSLKTKP